eukprot:TRINITY_DN6789_c0_g1_i1.p1 TRINITY_DN6789_c0_g1~~TRINITY_DN6789_c0_g1_i1.p1  ORF type:complete len:480 (+),score=74.13 TRINITY_DN6789_c0_g1_i1:86-1441(+)
MASIAALTFPPSEPSLIILAELQRALKSDPLLDELAFLKSVETEEYASINNIEGSIALQALFWTAENHKLAVAYFAVPPLLHAANAALFDPNIRKEEYQIATKCVLVLNADSYTAWNLRKKFVAISPENLRDELKFTSFILTKHPKSIETWVQRRWALERLVILEGQDLLSTTEYQEERRVVHAALRNHRRNYYAWRHMTWLLPRTKLADLLGEWRDISRFCREFPSDHSAHSFKMALMETILALAAQQENFPSPSPTQVARGVEAFTWETARARLEAALIASSLIQSTWMIETFPGHESTWQGRRAVLCAIRSRPHLAPAFLAKSKETPVVADIEAINQIDECIGLLGHLIFNNAHCHAWSGRTPVSDEDYSADDSDREALLTSSGTDIYAENLRIAVQMCGILDIELPSIPHSLVAEKEWAQLQSGRNDDAPTFVERHLTWLDRVMAER